MKMHEYVERIAIVNPASADDAPIPGQSQRRHRFRSRILPRPALSAEAVVVIVAVWFTLFDNGTFWRTFLSGRDLMSWSGVRLILGTAVLLTSAHTILLLPLSFRPVLKPFLTLHLLVAALTSWFIRNFHVYVDTSMIRNVIQTDARETMELINGSMISSVTLLGVVPAVALWLIRIRSADSGRSIRRKLATALMATALLIVAALASYGDYSSFFGENHEARYLATPSNYIVSLARAGLEESEGRIEDRIAIGQDATPGSAWARGDKPVVFVLVIGETARAANFSLDGYDRVTNPRLREIPVLNFRNVQACGTSTADSLPCMFSRFSQADYDPAKGRNYESLLDVLRHAGLEVVWLENNSGCKGLCDGVVSEDLSMSKTPGTCDSGECFDEILVTRMRELLSEAPENLVLVLHQKGSHGPAYSRRYPSEFARFRPDCKSSDFSECSKEEIQNAYDNSILYTDHVLASIIEELGNRQDRIDSAMLYVSDHGESLGERGIYLHGLPYAIAPRVQKHVPMILWLSDGYAERFAIDTDRLRARENDPLSHDNLFHTTLGLLDIETRELDTSLDILSSDRMASVEWK